MPLGRHFMIAFMVYMYVYMNMCISMDVLFVVSLRQTAYPVIEIVPP